MSRKDLVMVGSRVFALLLISTALIEATYLPERLFSLSHYLNHGSAMVPGDYWSRYYLLATSFLFFRMLALLMVAALFWKGGPWVETIFLSPQDDEEASE